MNNFILFFLLKKRKKMKRLKLLKIKIWMQDPSSKFPILHRVIGLMLIEHARSNVEFHEAPSVLFRRKKKRKSRGNFQVLLTILQHLNVAYDDLANIAQ